MATILMALALALAVPAAEIARAAARVADAVAQAWGAAQRAAGRTTEARGRVVVHVLDRASTGLGDPVQRALSDALAARGLETTTDPGAPAQVVATLSLRQGRGLVVARIAVEGQDSGLVFAELAEGPRGAEEPQAAPLVAIRTRTLFRPGMPVLDLEADPAGNLFVLHADRLRVFDLNTPGLPMKAEVGLDTGAERLRDPLVRLLARDMPHQLEMYSAAPSVGSPPPLPVEGYELRSYGAAQSMRVPHAFRTVTLGVQPVAGRNYFRALTSPVVQGWAAVASPLRAHWVLLDGGGRLLVADGDGRLIGQPLAGNFGGDIASASLPCAASLVFVASADAAPARDRLTVLRLDSDRLVPYTRLEVDGAVRRLKTLPATGDSRRVLAVADSSEGVRIEEIELRCTP